MNIAELIEKIQTLPEDKQAEVFDHVDFLAERFGLRRTAGDWTEREFQALSLAEAMRGMEDEAAIYGEEDIRERWS